MDRRSLRERPGREKTAVLGSQSGIPSKSSKSPPRKTGASVVPPAPATPTRSGSRQLRQSTPSIVTTREASTPKETIIVEAEEVQTKVVESSSASYFSSESKFSSTSVAPALSERSTFSTNTQKTVDIGPERIPETNVITSNVGDFFRRSVSKTSTSNKDLGGRVSRTPSSFHSESYEEESVLKTDSEDGEWTSNKSTVSYVPPSGYAFDEKYKERPLNMNYSALQIRDLGNNIGALFLLIVVPFLIYYLTWTCTSSEECNLKSLHLDAVTDLDNFKKVFPQRDVGYFLLFYTSLYILSGIMFGRYVRMPTDKIGHGNRFNALPISVLFLISLAVSRYLGVSILDYLLQNHTKFCVYAIINALVVALLCYVAPNFIKCQSWQFNSFGNCGTRLIDYLLGKHVNPKFGRINIKQVHYRASLIYILCVAVLFIFNSIEFPIIIINFDDMTMTSPSDILEFTQEFLGDITFHPTKVITSAMIFVYALDIAINEHHLASSFELQQEGLGALLLLRYVATPFFISNILVDIQNAKDELSIPALIALTLVFSAGLWIKRRSSSIKYQYRIAPLRKNLQNIETLNTYEGRRLLLGKYWGTVRQPNYAGEIIILLCLIQPVLFTTLSWPPILSILLLILHIFYRARRVNTRNSLRYFSAWGRYCNRVRYMIVPKIY